MKAPSDLANSAHFYFHSVVISTQKAIQLLAEKSDQTLSPERKKFNTLSKQIAKARKQHVNWQTQLPLFRVECANTLGPVRQDYVKVRRDIAFALGRVLDHVKLSEDMREDLTDCLIVSIQMLTEDRPMDDELKALFDKHSSVSFDEVTKAQAQMAHSFVSEFTGQSVEEHGEDESIDDYLDRMHAQLQEKIALEKEKHKSKKSSKTKTEPTKPSPASEEVIAQNLLKDVFRKLVSALHPDREQDPKERTRKTALMQQVNQAYANNELLTLLELQLDIEQIDQVDLQDLAVEKLRAYNKLLASQLKNVRAETQVELDRFCAENNLPRLKAQIVRVDDLKAIIKHVGYGLEEEIEVLHDELEFLYGVKKANRQLKVWVHEQLSMMGDDFDDFD